MRKYPVIVDPTVDHIEDSTNVINTYIYNGDSNITTYNKGKLLVGVDNNYTYRTLLKFNLPKIPASYKLVNANLRLFSLPESTSNFEDDKVICIHKVTKDWNEENAKWNNMNNQFSSLIENYFFFVKGTEAEVNYANVTKLVKDWYNNPESNYGLMLKLYNESLYKNNKVLAVFASNDTPYTGLNPKPLIEITYKNYNGVESYLSYSSLGHFLVILMYLIILVI